LQNEESELGAIERHSIAGADEIHCFYRSGLAPLHDFSLIFIIGKAMPSAAWKSYFTRARHNIEVHTMLYSFASVHCHRKAEDSPLPLHAWPHFADYREGTSRVDAFRIVQRRAKAAGLLGRICNHSFRATSITETAAHIAAHESLRSLSILCNTK
jgi:hypothetical protein